MQFLTWYNTEHRHSGIRYVTPEEKHTGKDVQILGGRSKTFKGAYARTPLRWSRNTRNREPTTEVILNPEIPIEEESSVSFRKFESVMPPILVMIAHVIITKIEKLYKHNKG